MPDAFDPYWKWLGIRTSEAARTPDHYRLLGIELFEDDADVICAAADRQMTHVRSYQAGPHALACQRILNELSAAKICLLNPAKKAAYDENLRRTLTRSASSTDRLRDGDAEEPPQIRVATDDVAFAPRGRRRPQRPILPRILAVTSVLTVVGLLIYVQRQGTGVNSADATSNHSEQSIRPTKSTSAPGASSQRAPADDENRNGGVSSPEQVRQPGKSPFPVGDHEPEPSVVPDRAPGSFVWPDEPEPASGPLLAGGPFGHVWGELARRNPTLAMVHARRLRGVAGKEFAVEDIELVEAIVQGIATFWTTVQSNEPQINIGDRLLWADETVVVAGIERSVPGQATITLLDSAGTAKKFALGRGVMPAELAASLFMYPQSTVRGQAALQLGLFYGFDREAHVDRARTLLDASVAEGGSGSMTIAQLETLRRPSRPDRASVPPDVATNPASEAPDVIRPLPSDVDIPPSVAESSPFQPPTAEEYEELLELVRTALGTRWQERSAAARREIASDLIVRAREPGIGTPAKYVLWNEVRRIGLEAGDVYLSLSASRQLAALYGERAGPGKMAELLNEIATHRGTKSGLENVLDAAIATAQEAVVVEDFVSASAMYGLAIKLARRLNFRDALAPLRQREVWVSAATVAAERFAVSVEKLGAEPMDAVANETVGRYLCFVRQDFAAGLAHLRHAENSVFRELSAAERAAADARRPVELAEMWMKAKSETAPYEQPALLLRTRYWFEQAIQQTTGLQKAAVEQRYREIVEQYDAIVPEIVVARDLIPLVQPQRDAVDGQWRLSEQGLHSASSHYARLALPIRVRGSFQLRLVFTRLEGESGNFATFPVGLTNASIVMNGKTDKRFVLGLVMVKNRWISDRADGVTAPLARGVRYVSEIRVVKNNRGSERVAIEAKVYADDASLRIAPQSYAWEGPIADLRVTELFTARPHQGNIVIGGNQVETVFHECRLLVAPDGEAQLLVP